MSLSRLLLSCGNMVGGGGGRHVADRDRGLGASKADVVRWRGFCLLGGGLMHGVLFSCFFL